MLWGKVQGAGGAGAQGWNVSTATFVRSFSVTTQETAPTGISFKPDGTKMYVVGSTNDAVNEYNLSTAWNISTATYLQRYVQSREITPLGMFFRPDGTKFYLVGNNSDAVQEFTLSTAWNVTTASFTQSFSVASQDGAPAGVTFRDDGLKMYVAGQGSATINEYTLSTAWSVSTATYVRQLSVSAQDAVIAAISFKPDGRRMYFCGLVSPEVNEMSLSTAWDISTATFSRRVSVSAQDSAPQGLFFKPDGRKMFVLGDSANAVYDYDLTA